MDKYLALVESIKMEVDELRGREVDLIIKHNKINENCDSALMEIHNKQNNLDDAEIYRKSKYELKRTVTFLLCSVVMFSIFFLVDKLLIYFGVVQGLSLLVSTLFGVTSSMLIYIKNDKKIMKDNEIAKRVYKVNREKLEQEEMMFEKKKAESLAEYNAIIKQITYKERVLEEIEKFDYDREKNMINGRPFTRKLVRD